jgi:tetratricopeptide (TPR) repeat protein
MNKTFSWFPVVLCCICLSCGQESGKSSSSVSTSTDSLSLLRQQVAQYPDSLEPRALLSQWLERNEGADAALQPILEGIALDSTIPFLYNRKAMLMLAKKDTAAAIRDLLQSLSLQPEQTDVHLELGFLYASQGNKGALVVAEFLLSQAEEPLLKSQARYMKGIYYANAGMKTDAMAMFNEIILNDYTFLDAYIEKGILLYNDKKYADALKTFDKSIAVSNTHAESYLWAAKCLEALGRKAEALDFYKKTVGFNAGLKEAEEGVARLEK